MINLLIFYLIILHHIKSKVCPLAGTYNTVFKYLTCSILIGKKQLIAPIRLIKNIGISIDTICKDKHSPTLLQYKSIGNISNQKPNKPSSPQKKYFRILKIILLFITTFIDFLGYLCILFYEISLMSSIGISIMLIRFP